MWRNPISTDFKTLIQLARGGKGEDHKTRLESFYQKQAANYDSFRKKLLPGRELLVNQLKNHCQGQWADLGCGTGYNLECFSKNQLGSFEEIHLLDFSPSLLMKAKERVAALGLENTKIIEEDILAWNPDRKYNLITLSYSLTMMPNWYLVLEKVFEYLESGGMIGVCDFYVSKKFAEKNQRQHGFISRTAWPAFFSWDNVFLNADHLPYLVNHFDTVFLKEGFHRLPYLPLGQVPYFLFIGRKT